MARFTGLPGGVQHHRMQCVMCRLNSSRRGGLDGAWHVDPLVHAARMSNMQFFFFDVAVGLELDKTQGGDQGNMTGREVSCQAKLKKDYLTFNYVTCITLHQIELQLINVIVQLLRLIQVLNAKISVSQLAKLKDFFKKH